MAVQRSDGNRLFPNWKELLLAGADRLEGEQQKKEAEDVRELLNLHQAEYLTAARRLQEHLEKSIWIDFLREQIDFDSKLADDDSLELARWIWKLGSRLLITTNYDRVLHWACPEPQNLRTWDIEEPAAQKDFLSDGFVTWPTIWHLHGHIRNPSGLILTPDAFENLYTSSETEASYGAALLTLKHLIAGRTLLFIGFSFDDRYIGVEMEDVAGLFDGLSGPHYCMLHEQEAGNPMPEGVVPITFADFGQPLIERMRELAELAGDGSPPNVQPGVAAPVAAASEPDLSIYRLAVAERWRNVRILRRSLNIQQHYFQARAVSLDREGEPIHAVNLLQAKRPERLCLFGPSGSGKTATLRRLLWELIEGRWVPFFIPLRDHSIRSGEEPDRVDLVAWHRAAVEAHKLDEALVETLVERIQQRRGLFIYDGFDELRFEPTRAARIADAIESFFAGQHGEAKVVITSRTEEDLQGRFAGYDFYRLLPVGKDQLPDFASQLELESTAVDSLLDELAKQPFFELRPVLLLVALLGIDTAAPSDREGIGTHFELLEWGLGRLLRDEQKVQPTGELSDVTPEALRSLRFYILQCMVRDWETSGRPVRLPETKIRIYAQKAFEQILGRELPSADAFRFLVPTGICLEREERAEQQYVFVHNSIQEFLYARVLRDHIRATGSPRRVTPSCPPTVANLLSRDYYSAEILRLLGMALDDSDIRILLGWAMAAKSSMARKVSVGALGFVRQQYRARVRQRLLEAFERETRDIGVAGRIVEALRRLGESAALGAFINKLDRYPTRPLRPESLPRPLTYEINEFLPELKGFTEALQKHLEQEDTVVRKHALILLLRGRELPRHWVVGFCLREVEATERVGETADDPASRAVEHLRSLRYGLEALRRLGTEAELELAQHLQRRLEKLAWVDTDVLKDVRRALRHLGPPPAPTAAGNELTRHPASPISGKVWSQIFEQIDSLDLYLIRHAESDGNQQQRFLGSELDGELTDVGNRQAKALAGELNRRLGERRRIHLASAPRERVQKTSEVLLAALPAATMALEPLLTEMHFGSWTGKTKREIASEDPEHLSAWEKDFASHRPPKGEFLFEVRARAWTGFRQQVERTLELTSAPQEAANRDARKIVLILVSHFFPLAELFHILTGERMPGLDNCAISHLELSRDGCQVAEINETGHLKGIGFKSPHLKPREA